jgi:hypothetical protein
MTGKPYGKFTLEQFKQLNDILHESQQLAPTLEKAIQDTDPQKLKRILGDNFSWFNYYEMPFYEHMAMGALILDWQMGMAGQGTEDSAVAGSQPAHPLEYTRGSRSINPRIAGSSEGVGPLQRGNGTASGQCHRLALVTDRPKLALCLDKS